MKTDNGGCPPESSCSVSSHADQTAFNMSRRGPSAPASPLSHLNLTPTQRELSQTRLSRVIAPLWENVTGPGDESGGWGQESLEIQVANIAIFSLLLTLFSHSVLSNS